MSLSLIKRSSAFLVLLLLLLPFNQSAANPNLSDGASSLSMTQSYYDLSGRLERQCSSHLQCTFFNYDKNGNMISKAKKKTHSLSNPSFETGFEDVGYYVANGNIRVDSGEAHTGTQSLKVSATPDAFIWQYQIKKLNQDITGRKFTVSASIKTANLTGGVDLLIYWMDAEGNWIWNNITASARLTDSHEWTRVTATAVAPYGATAIAPMIVSYAGTGMYWIDDFGIEESASGFIPLTNASFENGLVDVGYYVANGSISLDKKEANTGNTSLKISATPDEFIWQFQMLNLNQDITGRKFTVSASVKTTNLTGGVDLLIYWMDKNGNWIWSNITASDRITGTQGWTKVVATAVAPYGATQVSPMIVSYAGTGIYWIDSFEVTEE
jgi:hypothetical protein